MVKQEVDVLEDASKSTTTLLTNSRNRGRPRKINRNGILMTQKRSINKSWRFSLPGKYLRPRNGARICKSAPSYSTISCLPGNSDSPLMALCSSPSLDTFHTPVDTPVYNNKNKLSEELPHTTCDLVDVQELWEHYSIRAEYQAILSTATMPKSSKKCGKFLNRQNIFEKIKELKRIEQCIARGIKQITTFEFFNYVNPLCPGLNDVTTDVYIISCSADRVIQKDFLSCTVVPCRSSNHQETSVLYYSVPPNVEKSAVNIYLVVKVYIEQRYHYIGSARKIGRSRGELEPDVIGSPVLKRVLYGVRRVAFGGKEGVSPLFGNHTVVLINSDTDNVSGYPFSLTAEEWMWNCEQLAEFARIGNKLCSTGPIGLINFGISDEHVDYDWNMIEKIMCARSMRNIERTKESDLTVWYCCKGTCVDDETPAFTRNSPSSDKENRIGRYSPRRTPRSPQKPLFKTTPQNSNHVTDESACIFPPGVLDRVSGLVCPFTGKLFYNVDELEQHLRCSYPVFEFEKVTCTSSVICFVVSSVISRTQWHKPRLEFGSGKVSSVKETSPQLKPRYGPPEEIPVKRKHDLPKAQMIPFGEMSFVHPTYSQVPGPSSSKIYHSVVEDTCDWKNHLMERNIRDYIDDTPQEKEFMLLHNRFRSKFRHLIVGEKLTLDFYTKFVECCGMEMKKKRIRAHCVARLTRLVQQDKMTPTNMATLTQKLYELGPNDPS